MAAKIFRINYKSDFILTLNSDAGWMTPFCIKFWTGAPSQAFFVGWDGETYTHCAFDPSEPTKLLVQFDDHHLPIGDLKFQIAYHFTVADFPNDTEDEVINPANITTEIDGEEYQVMLDFNGETAPEIEFSLPAYANEAQRIANEQERIAAETQRIANEETRIQNEQTRVAQEQTRQQNEAQRIAQESARVSEFASLKSASESATRDANNAATLANEKAQLADDKAALADGAATQASLNAVYAHDEGQLAGQKAIEAAQATQLATNEAAFAHDQGNYAKQQGDYAKEQGDTALADHVRANEDHSTAAADHTTAGNDHTRAESDHSTSAADHTTAGNDHTRAESDHGIAVEDHTQAGNDHTRAESDHTTAAADHTTAGNDHTRAESDHTRAESDHAAVEVYVDSLGAFDISAYHATGGVMAEYADLTAALGTNGANIPDALRKGGMSVKFVQSSDHKYVQARCMAQNFTTDVTQWQGVDEEPAPGSENLVKSEGVAKIIGNTPIRLSEGFIRTANNTVNPNEVVILGNLKHAVVSCSKDDEFIINGSTDGYTALSVFTFCDSGNNVLRRSSYNSTYSDLCVVAPQNSAYCVINSNNDGISYFNPKNSINIIKSDKEYVKELSEYNYVYPELNAITNTYPPSTPTTARVYIPFNNDSNYDKIFVNIKDTYAFMIKQALSDDTVILSEDAFSSNKREVEIEKNAAKIVVYIKKLNETSFSPEDINFIINSSEIYFKKEKNIETDNSEHILTLSNTIGNKYKKINFNINKGRYDDNGNITRLDNRANIKLTDLGNRDYVYIKVPYGYKVSIKWLNDDNLTVKEKDSSFRKNSYQLIPTKGCSSIAINIAKHDEVSAITAEDYLALNVEIIVNENMSELYPCDYSVLLGYIREQDGEIDSTMNYRACIKIQNTDAYSKLKYTIPDGYYATFKFFDGSWICKDKSTTWVSGDGEIELNGYSNVALNIGKGAAHTEAMTQEELNSLYFGILLCEKSPSENIYNKLDILSDSSDEVFNIREFLYAYGSNIKKLGNTYVISNDITFKKHIHNPICKPLLVNMLCCSDNDVTIVARYNPYEFNPDSMVGIPNDTKCINDYVVENKKMTFVEFIMPPMVDSGILSITFPQGLKFKHISISEYSPAKKKTNIKFFGHLGAFLGANNIPSYQMCNTMGLDGCVANVLTTSDNVLVCAHDNSFTAVSNGQRYNISEKTYDEINSLGWYDGTLVRTKAWNRFFEGYRIPKVEDFLCICATTGMKPVFSLNINYSINWSVFNNLLIQYGFTEKSSIILKFKDGNNVASVMQSVYAVLGNKALYNYCVVLITEENYQNKVNLIDNIDLGDSEKGIEAWSQFPDEAIEYAIGKDIIPFLYESIYENPSNTYPYLTSKDIRNYIKKGIRYFTTDGFYSNGVNW